MTQLNIDLSQLSGVDPNIEHLKNARVDFSPYRAYPEADTWVTRNILRVKCPAGVATTDIPATPTGNAYEVQERGFRGARHGYVLVPDQSTVEYVDLVWVDKATLDRETPLDPAWVTALDDVIADVDTAQSTADTALTNAGVASGAATTAQAAAVAAQSTADAAVTGLGSKVNTSTYTAGLAAKADTSALAAKADTSALTSGLAGKVDTSTYTSGLAAKADASALTSGLAAKVDLTATGRDALALSDYAKLRPYFAQLANRNNRLVNIGMVGASTTEGLPVTSYDKTTAQRLAASLRARLPTRGLTGGGRGIIGAPTTVVYAAGTWPQVYDSGALFDDATFNFGIKHRCWYSTDTKKMVHTFTEGVTSFSIDISAGSSGNATGGYYKINGGTSVTFSTANATTVFRKITVSGTLAAGSTVEVGRTAGTLIFSSITEYNGDETKGIQVHNLGHASYSAAQWAVGGSTAGWLADMAARNLDLLILQDFGPNDGLPANGNKTAAQFKTSLLAFIALLRGAGITCPIVLSAVYDTTDVFVLVESWSLYVTAMKEIAAADATIVFIDHGARMPAHASTDPYSLYNGAADPHSNPSGAAYQFMADNYLSLLLPR